MLLVRASSLSKVVGGTIDHCSPFRSSPVDATPSAETRAERTLSTPACCRPYRQRSWPSARRPPFAVVRPPLGPRPLSPRQEEPWVLRPSEQEGGECRDLVLILWRRRGRRRRACGGEGTLDGERARGRRGGVDGRSCERKGRGQRKPSACRTRLRIDSREKRRERTVRLHSTVELSLLLSGRRSERCSHPRRRDGTGLGRLCPSALKVDGGLLRGEMAEVWRSGGS